MASYEWLHFADASQTRELAMHERWHEPSEDSYTYAAIAVVAALAALLLWLWVF